jgi:hypothetical protein
VSTSAGTVVVRLHANGELFEVDHGDVMRAEREILRAEARIDTARRHDVNTEFVSTAHMRSLGDCVDCELEDGTFATGIVCGVENTSSTIEVQLDDSNEIVYVNPEQTILLIERLSGDVMDYDPVISTVHEPTHLPDEASEVAAFDDPEVVDFDDHAQWRAAVHAGVLSQDDPIWLDTQITFDAIERIDSDLEEFAGDFDGTDLDVHTSYRDDFVSGGTFAHAVNEDNHVHSGVEFSDVEHGASYGGVGELSFADLQPEDAILMHIWIHTRSWTSKWT